MDHLWLDKSFILYEDYKKNIDWDVIGIPFDSTETSIPGQRFAPNAIRNIIKNKDSERRFNDLGNVIVVHGNPKETIKRVYEISSFVLNNDKKLLALGGEHTITYGILKAYKEKYNNIQLIYFDAHYDTKEYEYEKLTHMTFARAIIEDLSIPSLNIGARRYDIQEKEFVENNFISSLNKIKRNPTYISIDLDYFDISLSQGCADKESNGYYFKDFKNYVDKIIQKVGVKNIVGIDIVELNPLLDTSKITATLAADILLYLINML